MPKLTSVYADASFYDSDDVQLLSNPLLFFIN